MSSKKLGTMIVMNAHGYCHKCTSVLYEAIKRAVATMKQGESAMPTVEMALVQAVLEEMPTGEHSAEDEEFLSEFLKNVALDGKGS